MYDTLKKEGEISNSELSKIADIKDSVSWKIGGQAGEGIDTTGDVFAESLVRYGVHLFTHREFPSRIRGGYTSYEVRFGANPILCQNDKVDFVVAFDQEIIDNSIENLNENGILVYNSSIFTSDTKGKKLRVYAVPLTDIAHEVGNNIMKNMVALGVTVALLGMDAEIIYEGLKSKFGEKNIEILNSNYKAVEYGYNYVLKSIKIPEKAGMSQSRSRAGLYVSGSETVALGALVAGCRFYGGYPITPATDIMQWIIPRIAKWGGTYIQAEDELAAINMVLGASFAGVRAMTATSGPGLDLMTETISLASMIEAPAVIVDVQRGGPSTGLPTKHEQSDIWQAIFSSHGDSHRIVLTASTTENAFFMIQEAFNISELYQTPVILLLDQDLNVSKRYTDPDSLKIIPIERGNMVADNELLTHNQSMLYRRYMFTDDGVSPRTIPTQKNGLYLATGDEHDEEGHIIENPELRARMMDKRSKKYEKAREALEFKNRVEGSKDATVALIGIGSVYGPAMEALRMLSENGIKAKYMDMTYLWPFPENFVNKELEHTTHNIIIENNESAQLYRLFKMFSKRDFHSIKKYDGTPFKPKMLYDEIRKVLQ